MAELRAAQDVKRLAFEFLILTSARTDEVLGATWAGLPWRAAFGRCQLSA